MKFTGERFIPEGDHLTDEIGYEHLHRYYAAATLMQNKDVLDIACGEGYGSAILAAKAGHVTGVDIDEESIEWASKKYTQQFPNLIFKHGSATSIPAADASFDVVVSFETIEHLDETMQQDFILEIKRVLRPSGVVIMSTPDKKNYSDRYAHENHFHLKEFYRDEFCEFITKHFSHATFFDQGYEIVSVISNKETEKENTIQLHKWNADKPTERKYLIAIASAEKLPHNIFYFASIVPEVDKNFSVLMDRLVQMNTEIESLGAWGHALDKQLIALQDKSNTNQSDGQQNDRLMTEHVQMLKELEQKDTQIKTTNQQLQEKELLLSEMQHQLHHLHQESNKIRERLSDIYASDGWKLLSPYYKLKGKLLPENSGRYKKLKKIFNAFRNKKNSTSPVLNIEAPVNVITVQEAPENFEVLALPIFDHPVVSIIIPAYNAWSINYQCIKSIIANSPGTAYEVLLADDCSTDETSNCTNKIKNLVHIRPQQNLGFLKNCNHAAGFSKGKYILFLNNDTQVRPNWLSPLINLMESDEKIGMAGSKLIYPDGRLQEAGGIIWKDASGWNYGHKQDPQLPQFNYVKEVDYVSGASIIIRKKAWLELNGFDERYSPAYCEDSDFAFSLRKAGYKVMYQPMSEVIHYEGYSHGTDATLEKTSDSIKSYQQINNKKFFQKWQAILEKEQFANGENVFQARDRSKNKKTILVIDHYVPHFDKDAGSKTTFQYLNLFKTINLNVKFIGDNFFKHEPYTTALEQMGIEVLYGPWYRDNWQQWIKDNAKHIDYIYINRPHISIKYIDFIKAHTKALILYYGHDLHFLREEKKYEVEKNLEILKSAEQWKATETYLFNKSDIILTPSIDEEQVITAMNSTYRVETILPYFFKEPALPITNFNSKANIIFAGGFGHSPNVDAITWFCTEVWPIVTQELPFIKFIIVGSNPPEEIKALQSESVDVKGFVSENTLRDLYSKSKLAVIPLRYGAGVKGKTIEAMYHGVPIVSTSFGIEGMPGDYAWFLKSFDQPKQFANEVISLYNNEDALIKLSKDETNYINDNFTQKAASQKMQYMLNLKNNL